MRVEIGDLTLHDDDTPGSSFHDHSGSISRLLDVSSPLGAPAITARNLTTKTTRMRFSITRAAASADEALGEWFAHEASIPADVPLRFITATRTVSIPGQLEMVDLPRRTGSRMQFAYSFVGGVPVVTTTEGDDVSASRHDQTITPSAAGSTTLSFGANIREKYALVQPAAGAGAYEHNVVLLTTDRQLADSCKVTLEMPASANPTIKFRNATAGGTDLTAGRFAGGIVGLAGAAIYVLLFVFNGTAWSLRSFRNES